MLLLATSCQVADPEIPPTVVKDSRPIKLTGKTVTVDFYTPASLSKAPVVIVAHGFSRSRRYMAGWGVLLAKNGFSAAVLDQPYFADHTRNGKAIAELTQQIRSGTIPLKTAPDGRFALVGMSMGGLTTLLAAAQTPVDAWLGLDPVDTPGGRGAEAAKDLHIPSAFLLAEPALWNAFGNARGVIRAFPEAPLVIKVNHASHCDTESPTDFIGGLATGGTSRKRLAAFDQYLIAFFKATFQNDDAARKELEAAKQDPRVTVMERTER